jgi:HSP20 family molecular chaperone IbpA
MEGTIMTKRLPDLFVDFEKIFDQPFFIDTHRWFADQLIALEGSSDFLPHDEVEYEDGTREVRIAVSNYTIDDITATVEGNLLRIEGLKEQTKESEEDVKYIRKGIAARKFIKSFFIPDDREVGEVSLKNGMLYVKFPKVEKENVRKIEIKS